MTKFQKEIILGSLVALLSIFAWWFFKYVFYVGDLSLGCWISGIILFIAWGIGLCLAMLLIDDKRILYGSFGLGLVLFFIFFNNHPIYYLIVLILLFLGFWRACFKIRKEEKYQVALDFWKIWKRGLPLFITTFILVVCMVYYFSPELMNKKETKIKIPEKVFNLIIKPLEGLIKEQLPQGIDLDSDVSKFLPLDQKNELERQFGIKINKGETGRDVLYKLVDYQLNNITGPYRKFIPLGLAIGLFVTLKIISLIYVALVILLSWIAIKILIALNFVKLKTETKEVETVKL